MRKDIPDRYDDRDDIRTNLIDSYDRLMTFVEKHLPDPFYLEGDVRISLRDRIFREAVVNILIHREYTQAFPAKMIIGPRQVVFENANRPHGHGLINPETFTPFPKNPVIARIFKEIGLAEELGSGVRNLFKYTRVFSKGANPQLIEDDIFRIIIPITEQVVIDFCKVPRSTKEIMDHVGLKHREHFRSEVLKPLLEKNMLFMTIPDKPNSPKQQYVAREPSND